MADTEWTADVALALLLVLAGYDRRWQMDDQEAEDTAEQWARILTGERMSVTWAARWVDNYHSEPRQYVMQLGELRQAWRVEQRGSHSREPNEIGDILRGQDEPAWVRDLYAESQWAASDGRRQGLFGDALTAYMDERVSARASRPMTAEQEAASRKDRHCGIQECRCRHATCRAGFLDGDDLLVKNGQRYRQNARCPGCYEAALSRRSRAKG